MVPPSWKVSYLEPRPSAGRLVRPSLYPISFTSGCRVARPPAVMASDCSTVDQMTTSDVSYRKSSLAMNFRNGIRIITAVLALCFVTVVGVPVSHVFAARIRLCKGCAYMQPRPMRTIRASLVLSFMLRCETIQAGSRAKVKSLMMLMTLNR